MRSYYLPSATVTFIDIHTMTFTPAALHALLAQYPSPRCFWVALSGGLDSVVLLDALAQLDLPAPVHALHINHQISPNADDWQQHCAHLCEKLGVVFQPEKVDVARAGRGLEDAAREARYKAFKHYVGADDVLLTGHHANDQAETLLLRLMRGTGPRGLAAMARRRPLGVAQLLRPLLDFTRAELEEYALARNLTWVEDESNADIHYDRNFIRRDIMPLLHSRWPDFTRRWQQTAELCADNEVLLNDLAAQDLTGAQVRKERLGVSIDLPFLSQLSRARRHNLLRHWLITRNLPVPEQSHLQQFEQQLMGGRADAEAEVRWGDVLLRRYRERLYLLSVANMESLRQAQRNPVNLRLMQDKTMSIEWDGGMTLTPVYCSQVTESGFLRADFNDAQVRWRQGGERCRPQGRTHSQTLKRLLQEYGLEPWLREFVPLLFINDELAAVGDLWVCEDYAAGSGQAGCRLVWQFTSAHS